MPASWIIRSVSDTLLSLYRTRNEAPHTTSSTSSGQLYGTGQFNGDSVSNALRLPLPDTQRPKGLDKEQWMLVKLTTDAIVKAKAGLRISSRVR